MKTLFIIILIFPLLGCSMFNQCAERGAKWGALYGIFKTNNTAGVYIYSAGGRVIGSRYCD